MIRNKTFKTLMRSEMQIMNVLWDNGKGMTTHEILDTYEEPRPAYSTVATFMKILCTKQFVGSHKKDGGGKPYVYYPIVTRAEYTRHTMSEVKESLFGGSLHSLISFFAKEENISDAELSEIMAIIDKNNPHTDDL